MYIVTEYQVQQLRNRYPNDEVVKEIQTQSVRESKTFTGGFHG